MVGRGSNTCSQVFYFKAPKWPEHSPWALSLDSASCSLLCDSLVPSGPRPHPALLSLLTVAANRAGPRCCRKTTVTIAKAHARGRCSPPHQEMQRQYLGELGLQGGPERKGVSQAAWSSLNPTAPHSLRAQPGAVPQPGPWPEHTGQSGSVGSSDTVEVRCCPPGDGALR